MRVRISDCSLHYEEAGTGEPLLLLHGNGEDGTYFKGQMARFSSRFRVIALDTRGHGKSERGSAEFSIDRFAEDLREALDALGLLKVHLLGFSDGGNIAVAFALKYPERLRSLILNGANLRPSGVKLSVQAPVVLGYAICCLLSPFSREAVRKRELLGLMVTQPHVRFKELERIHVPALVIVGDRDMIRESHTRKIAAHIRGSRLAILQGSHFVAAEDPEAFNRAVGRFFADKVAGPDNRLGGIV